MIVLNRSWSLGKAFVSHSIRWGGVALTDNELSKLEEVADERGVTQRDLAHQAMAIGMEILLHRPETKVESTTEGHMYDKDRPGTPIQARVSTTDSEKVATIKAALEAKQATWTAQAVLDREA